LDSKAICASPLGITRRHERNFSRENTDEGKTWGKYPCENGIVWINHERRYNPLTAFSLQNVHPND